MKTTCLPILSGALLAAGCASPLGGGSFVLELAVSDTLVGVDRPATITITATNTGDRVVAWGQGSSSCQLTAVVREGSADRPIDVRACTDDLVVQGLGAGQTRTEQWDWTGQVLGSNGLERLPAGSYQLVPMAGEDTRGDGRRIRVQGP